MIWTTFATARVEAAPIIQWTKLSSTPIAGLVLDNLKTWIHRPLEDSFWNAEAQSLIIVAQRAIAGNDHAARTMLEWFVTEQVEEVSSMETLLRTIQRAGELLSAAAQGEEPLGACPQTGKPVFLRVGRFGPYVQRGTPDDEENRKRIADSAHSNASR